MRRSIFSLALAAALLSSGAVFAAADEASDPSALGEEEGEGTKSGPGDVWTPRKDMEVKPPRGFKRRAQRSDPGLTEAQSDMVRQLEAIGYVDGSVAVPAASSVTVHDPSAAQPGLNFYTSTHGPEALLVDMDGRELHRWTYDPQGSDRNLYVNPRKNFWRRGYLLDDGALLVIVGGRSLLKLDKDSRLLWANLAQPHHDLEVMPNGEIYVLTREARLLERIHPEKPVLEDFVSVLDAEGQELRRVSILECFENSEYEHVLKELKREAGDLFHTNSLDVLDGRHAARAPAFAAGNVLISLRTLDALAVLDLDAKKVVWYRTGDFRAQHDARLLDSGRILFFDNLGAGSSSRILEVDPESFETRWEYRGSADRPFYSHYRGIAMRLDNGNTLITESDNGRAFEVTPAGRIVWEYFNPHVAGEKGEFIAAINDMTRVSLQQVSSWLEPAP